MNYFKVVDFNQDMSNKPDYLIKLEELYNSYKGQEVADALGVTVRQIQNYLKATSPAMPSKDVLRRIHETYTKHEKGESILVSAAPDYKDRYIQLLEDRINLSERKQLVMLQRNQALLNAIVETLPILVSKIDKVKLLEAHEEMNKRIEHHLDVLKKESI